MENKKEEIKITKRASKVSFIFPTIAILFAVIMIVSIEMAKRIEPPPPPPPGTSGTSIPTPPPPEEDNVGPKWDYISLTPGIFNKIIQKIKSAPNTEIKAIESGGQSTVTFYYSFVTHDPCEPLLKDFLVFEIETTTYVDENGQQYPNGPNTDYYAMRDIDHDNFPEDYFIPGDKPNPDAKLCDPFLPLTKDTPDIDGLLSLWETGMNYFDKNLLK